MSRGVFDPPAREGLDGWRGRFRRSLAELHARLRTEGESPPRQAAAIGVGVFIGCSPFYGFHFPLCVLAAKLFGLNRLKAYLASNISLPIFAPFLLLAEVDVGRFLRGAPPLALHPSQLKDVPLGQFGLDLLLGSAVVGLVLGGVAAAVAYRAARAIRRHPQEEALIDAASERYLDCGLFAWEFVRGKLRHDPLYFGILRRGLLPAAGRLVDLGCGRGILLSLLVAAREAGVLPPDWPPAPSGLELIGVEGRGKIAAQAARALAGEATIATDDLATAAIPAARAILLLDVLHYLPAAAQEDLLDRVAAALEPGGLLLIRDADAGGGGRFLATRVQERLAALARGHLGQRFHYRSAREWSGLLAARGLVVEATPLAQGTPYANVLVVGRTREGVAG